MSTTTAKITNNERQQQAQRISQYYVLQSKIYDLTRWSFLFGRNAIIREIRKHQPKANQILEIGCGTGRNLIRVANAFPEADIKGMDVSLDMLRIAHKRLKMTANQPELVHQPYQFGDDQYVDQIDVIIFSYSLTMINPQWSELIQQAYRDLAPGGIIAVADFHDTPFHWFKNHMGNHHVRMDGHLLPVLESRFNTEVAKVQKAYGGVWSYLSYIGRKP